MNFSQKYLFWTNSGDIIYQVKTKYHHKYSFLTLGYFLPKVHSNAQPVQFLLLIIELLKKIRRFATKYDKRVIFILQQFLIGFKLYA
jgi:hypothetical protein